jgi:hypothetical protein
MEVFNEAFNFKFKNFLEEEVCEVSKKDCKKYCKVSLQHPRAFLEKMITKKYGYKVTNNMMPKIRKHFPRNQMFYYTVCDDPDDEDSIVYTYYKGNIDLHKFNNKRVRKQTFTESLPQVRKLRVEELKKNVEKLTVIEDEEMAWAVFSRVISRKSPIIYPNLEEFRVMLDNIKIYKGWVRKALECAKSEMRGSEEDSSEEDSENDSEEDVRIEENTDPPDFQYDPNQTFSDEEEFERFLDFLAVSAEEREYLRGVRTNLV